jgi:hypothetical protein
MNNQTSFPTLRQLVTRQMKEQGLSRSQLMQAMGLINVSKGLRRLDHYLQTLEAPSDDFVSKLLAVLDINGLAFCRAIATTQGNMSERSRKTFKPCIQLLLDIDIRGAMACQMVQNKCMGRIPETLQTLPFEQEVTAVLAAVQQHIDTAFAESSLGQHVAGFRYYRGHNYYLQFDAKLILVKIRFLDPAVPGRQPLANRIADILTVNI